MRRDQGRGLRYLDDDTWGALSADERKERAWAAVLYLHDQELERRADYDPHLLWYHGIRAQSVAYLLGVGQARRNGNGAVKGSWSGYMPAALRVAPALKALAAAGALDRVDRDYTWHYVPAGFSWH